jgi:hypothetical protein
LGRAFVALLLCGASELLLVATDAHAEPPYAEHDPIYLSGDANLGLHGLSGSGVTGGADIGADLFFRFRVLEAGAIVDAGGPVIGPGNRTAVAGLLGFGNHGDGSIGGDLLFEGGMHSYSGVGRACSVCDDPGGNGTVGFVGARAGITFQGPHETKTVLPVLGFWAWASADTSSALATYSFMTCSDFSSCSSVTKTASIGGAVEVGIAFRVGLDWHVNAHRHDADDGRPPPSTDTEDELP